MNLKDLSFEEVKNMERTFSIEKLLSAGYKEYKMFVHPNNQGFQKTIKNATGEKKYFINVEKWNWNEPTHRTLKNNPYYEFNSSVNFFLQDETGLIVKYDICSVKHTIEEMEQFYEEIYYNMKCIPDIHNN